MKNIILGLALISSVFASAQIDFRSTRFGVTGGYNYSRVQNAHNPSGARHTFQFGAMALIPVDQYNQFYIQPELVYYAAGETGRDGNLKNKANRDALGYNAMYANNYISLPIYFKAYFSDAESEFFGLLGPRFNFLVSQKVEKPSKPIYSVEGVGDVNGKANFFDFAIGGGIGYSYKRKLEISGRYDLGLTNTYPGLLRENGQDPAIAKKKSQQVASIVLTYIFD